MELSQLYDHNMGIKMPKQEMHFPIDVLTNILNRLPSTSVIRFQIISKYWCYVIRVSDVLNAHPRRSYMTVQLTTGVVQGELTHYNFDDKGNIKKSVHNINPECALNYTLSNVVNGLACAYGNKTAIDFYLINLTTFETSKYTKREIKGITVHDDQISLGLDPSTGLYKFIRMYLHSEKRSYYCEILEIGAPFKGSWKFIGEFSHTVKLEKPVFLNGAIHWLRDFPSLNKGKPLAFNMLKLDMKKEAFENVAPIVKNEFDQNDYGVFNWVYDFSLSEENGKLYVLRWCCRGKYLCGWRLEESERDEGVWNVVFRVNFASMADVFPWCYIGKHDLAYVFGIVDGKVLIRSERYGKGVYMYNLVNKKLSYHSVVSCGCFYSEHGRQLLFYRKD